MFEVGEHGDYRWFVGQFAIGDHDVIVTRNHDLVSKLRASDSSGRR
jgi:hypothetical protein